MLSNAVIKLSHVICDGSAEYVQTWGVPMTDYVTLEKNWQTVFHLNSKKTCNKLHWNMYIKREYFQEWGHVFMLFSLHTHLIWEIEISPAWLWIACNVMIPTFQLFKAVNKWELGVFKWQLIHFHSAIIIKMILFFGICSWVIFEKCDYLTDKCCRHGLFRGTHLSAVKPQSNQDLIHSTSLLYFLSILPQYYDH